MYKFHEICKFKEPLIKEITSVLCMLNLYFLLHFYCHILYCHYMYISLITLYYYIAVGNEVHIVIGTDTEYEKKDKTNHYGIKCKVIGYEWSDNAQQVQYMCGKQLQLSMG